MQVEEEQKAPAIQTKMEVEKEKEPQPEPIHQISYTKRLNMEQFLPESHIIVSEYKCPLCNGIYYKPIIDQCGHIFCNECFQLYFKTFKQCPISKNQFTIKPLKVIVISQILDKQTLRCNNKENGCNWEGLLKDLETHIQTECPKEKVECDHEGCNQQMFREFLQNHKEKCEYRVTKCDDCNIKLPFNKLSEHQEICPKFKILCSQQCGEKIEREKISEHINSECKLTLLNCPFERYGCKHDRIYRKDLTQKLKNEASEHLLLIFETIDKFKAKIEEIDVVKREVDNIKKEGIFTNNIDKNDQTKEKISNNILSLLNEDSIHCDNNSIPLYIKRARSPSKLLNEYPCNLINTKEQTVKKAMKEESKNLEMNFAEEDYSKKVELIKSVPLKVDSQNSIKIYDVNNKSNAILITGSIAKLHSNNKPEHKYLFSSKSIDLNLPIETFSWSVKLITPSMWIGMGLCDKDQVIQNKMKFTSSIVDFNHGSYLLSSNGYSWNCSIGKENNVNVENVPKIAKGIIIDMEYNLKKNELTFSNQNKCVLRLTNVIPVVKDNKKLTPCIVFLHNGDCAEMLFK